MINCALVTMTAICLQLPDLGDTQWKYSEPDTWEMRALVGQIHDHGSVWREDGEYPNLKIALAAGTTRKLLKADKHDERTLYLYMEHDPWAILVTPDSQSLAWRWRWG